jgi:hypothetical protein
MTTRQPVVMDEWPAISESCTTERAITTIARWRGAYEALA